MHPGHVLTALLFGCNPGPDVQTPKLPGELIVYQPSDRRHLRYTADATAPFVPVEGYTDDYDIDWDPSTSPDGSWTLSHDPVAGRYVIHNDTVRHVFAHYCFAPSQIAWSPDSRFLAYRADDDQSAWTARIMVLDVSDGSNRWIGTGESPRWYASAPPNR